MHHLHLAWVLLLATFVGTASAADPADAATKQMAAFTLPAGMKVELFSAEPKLGSPVAIGLDEKNRVFVAEEYRIGAGVPENRGNPAFDFTFFLDDDLQTNTLEGRLANYRKWQHKLPGGFGYFSKNADQVRRLEDTDGDGKADKSTVFAGGFNDPLDGLAAGVMAHDGDVFFTCIPHLWRIRDTDGDGVADEQEKLLTGFGVNIAFYGHDLHGLILGPDGKLYFSVGDRGFHVTSKEGKTYSGPRAGAVFRCDPDGSNFEVVMRGLRNPQELAFDQYGNLFADDNNCDKGDHARLVYVVEDGDAGWNMAYQSIPAPYMSGPWFAERLWHLPHAGQPAYIVPPVGKIGTGPGGFLFTSGTSLADRYRNSFLMCNYTGNGGLEAFKVKPKGAGFEIDDYHDFLKPIRATDAEFGTDGKLYVSDFVNLDWSGKSLGGRVYTLFDPKKLNDPVVQETKKLFAEGFKQRSVDELLRLLGHADQRVRLRAQLALVSPARAENSRVISRALRKVATEAPSQLARLHGIWGLAQLARQGSEVAIPFDALLADPDAEVRAQSAKIAADFRVTATSLIKLLADPNPRVRFFAAQSLGKLKHKPAVSALFQVLKTNNDADPFLRHACVVALARINDSAAVDAHASDSSSAVRLGVVLVQRRLRGQGIVRFLDDPDPLVRTEAARAIHDLPMEEFYPALAGRLAKYGETPIPDGDPLARRAISANYRLGGPIHAKAVLAAATNPNFSPAVRDEAVAALRDWAEPPPRDRVTGFWRSLPRRDPTVGRGVVETGLTELLAKTRGKLQADAIGMVLKLGVKAESATFVSWASDKSKEPNVRVAALRFLAGRSAKELATVLMSAMKDSSPLVRAEARDLIAASDAVRGVSVLAAALADSTASAAEKQRAISALARVQDEEASAVLDWWAVKLARGRVPGELRLDVLDALKASPAPTRDKLRAKFEAGLPRGDDGKFVLSLVGGDADRGRDVFFGHSAAQCVRCHTVHGVGGTAGPDLTELVKRNPVKTREHILESMVHPNAKIAQGFATTSITTLDGKVVAGTVAAEDQKSVTVKTPEGKSVTVPLADVDTRTAPPSAMPSVERTLTPHEMRDLIEFLATLK